VQVPLAVEDDPFRNCPSPQLPFSVHLNPLVVPEQEPVLYCDAPQLMLEHDVQVPLTVAEDPLRNWFDVHLGCSAHLNPLVVPEHEPVLYCAEPQFALLQLEHW